MPAVPSFLPRAATVGAGRRPVLKPLAAALAAPPGYGQIVAAPDAPGLRGAWKRLNYDVFMGAPIVRPRGYPTADVTFGFSLLAGF